MKMNHLLSLSSMVLLATACASGGARTPQSATTDGAAAVGAPATPANAPATNSNTRRSRGSANLITADELRESNHGNVYELVAASRPEWLRASGVSSMTRGGGVTAYVDQTRLGGVMALRDIPLNQARAIRYYPPSEAQSRFGLDNMAGVIQVETGGR